MARGRKPKDETEQEADDRTQAKASVKPGEVKEMISQNKLMNLIKTKRSSTKETAEINGRVGQAIADAVEKNHLHRKAFGVICALDRMEPEKIADFLDHFRYYLDISGIEKRAGSVMRMQLDETAEEPDETNVAKFPTAGNA